MQVHQVEFLISAVRPEQYPEADRPEIALAGRSNVGKSTFINTMVRRKNIARTSSKPGKTQQLNYYDVEDSLYFVDVPGYGFARVSKSEKKKWQEMLERYFRTRTNLVLALLLVDFRHAPSKEDIQMKEFFEAYEIPYFVIATKSDKVKRSQWNKHLAQIKESLDLVTEDQILPFSSKTAEAKDEAWEIIEDVIAGAYED